MVDRLLERLDAILGVTDGSPHDRLYRFFLGVLVPLFPLWYGVTSIITQQSLILGRRHFSLLREFSGKAAMMAGAAYVCLGLLLHIHNVSHEHPQLAGVADAGRLVSLLGFGHGFSWAVYRGIDLRPIPPTKERTACGCWRFAHESGKKKTTSF